MSVTSLVLSHQVDRHALRHGVIGYRSPKCPLGSSVEFPRKGMSRVTFVTTVPREGTRRCVPLPCLGLPVYISSDKRSIQQVPFYTFGYPPMMSRATWTNRIGVVLHMLQTPVMLAAFPKVSTRTQRLIPSQRNIYILCVCMCTQF